MRGSHGTFYWNELMTRNVAGAKKFYADTMGWNFDAMPMPTGGTYWVAKMNAKPVGGMFDISGADFTACRKAGCPISPSTISMRGSRRPWPPARK